MELKKSEDKGFTLTELLIILAVIAVLAAVVIISVSGMSGRGGEEALATETTIIQSAVVVFNSDLHRGPANGNWGEGPIGHYYPTDDGLTGALTKASFPIPAGDTNPASTLDGIIWMGLLANSPRDGGGDSPATAAPRSDEEGPYLTEIPESSSIYNGNLYNSGPYTWIILSDGIVAAVELVSNHWVLIGEVPVASSSPTPPVITDYTLILASTDGGSITTPGEGEFMFPAGTQVDLFAVADECREFVEWTGDVDTIANVDAAETTITMEGDYSVTANFATAEFVRVSIRIINPEINAWIRIVDTAGEIAVDKYGVPVDGTNHQTPADIWIPWGEYTLTVSKPLMNWEKTVPLPPLNESACSITVEIPYD